MTPSKRFRRSRGVDGLVFGRGRGQNASSFFASAVGYELMDTCNAEGNLWRCAMQCRVCGSSNTTETGVVEYIVGFAWAIYDCGACGCRFTRHESTVYNTLHKHGSISYYDDYRSLAAESKRLFDLGDIDGLRSSLAASRKYAFVIKEVDRLRPDARLLEFGCSRGYLSAFSILAGRNILGVDVASEAVESAVSAFGDYFALTDSSRVDLGAPYDLIYHVGMIGCVADPMGLTKRLLSLLKPGGRLVFNSPNRSACLASKQLWFDSAPPPDVVTLFPPTFWRRQFAEQAEVIEQVDLHDANRSFVFAIRDNFGRAWRPPQPRPLTRGSATEPRPPAWGDRAWRFFERVASKAARVTRMSQFARRRPTEFGLFVTMIAK